MSNTLCPNCGGKGWTGDGTDGRHKCPDCTGKLPTPSQFKHDMCSHDSGLCLSDSLVGDKTDDSLDALVRDACSVVPVPKSEYRNRLEALIQAERIKAKKEVLEAVLARFGFDDGEMYYYLTSQLAELDKEQNNE